MMCRILLILFFCIQYTGFSSSDSIFNHSNKLFTEGMYIEAIAGYNSIVGKDSNNGTLYYNIGNCYYRLDSLAKSILYFEKARLYNPNDDDIIFNIEVANKRLIDEIKFVPDFIFVTWFKQCNNLLTSSQWACLLICLLYLTFSLFVCFLLSSDNKFKFKIFRVCLLLIPVIFFCLIFLLYSTSSNRFNYGILMDSIAYVKTSPSESSSDYFIIHEGVKFEIIDQLNDWCRIKLIDGKDGWIQHYSFNIITR